MWAHREMLVNGVLALCFRELKAQDDSWGIGLQDQVLICTKIFSSMHRIDTRNEPNNNTAEVW